MDAKSGAPLGVLEPPADGWDEFGDLEAETGELLLRFTRRPGDTYITCSEIEVRGEELE